MCRKILISQTNNGRPYKTEIVYYNIINQFYPISNLIMIQKLSAIYENGLLRPLHNLNLPEKSEVNLVIESNPPLTPPSKKGEIGSEHPLLQFAGILSDGEAEDIENIINQELRTVNNDEW